MAVEKKPKKRYTVITNKGRHSDVYAADIAEVKRILKREGLTLKIANGPSVRKTK